MRPTRLNLSVAFFNQNQKFFVARRAEQRRFRHATPMQISLRGDECFQFFQHTFVDGRVGGDEQAGRDGLRADDPRGERLG